MKVVEYDLGAPGRRLLIVLHHLIVDGVSWRILIDDIERAFEQLTHGEVVTLELVPTTFSAWARRLHEYGSQIGDEMKTRWPVSGVAIVHRTGVLAIGQASVAIAVAAPHRGEAFQAAQYAIDRLKQIVPIWKKEVWSDGSQWIGWEHEKHA